MKANAAFRLLLLGFAVTILPACNRYDPYHPDTTNLEGIWALDNTYSRRIDEVPVDKRLNVYATHMEFQPGQGAYGVQGQWRDGGFWCDAANGSGQIEAVKVLDAETVELHVSAFISGNTDVLVLYKERGDEAETAAILNNPPPVISPPPPGSITVGMPEYVLKTLPWKPDQVSPIPDDLSKYDPTTGFSITNKDNDGTIYSYRSNNPAWLIYG